MRTLSQILSWLSLVGLLVAPCRYLAGTMPLDSVKGWMLVFTVAWFVTVPLWMERKEER
jgi:hypothetical protein